jgi:hypothetical protein
MKRKAVFGIEANYFAATRKRNNAQSRAIRYDMTISLGQ